MRALWDLLIAFGRVGLFGYGGGPSMIPLLQEEVVDHYRWLTLEQFVDALAMGNALPGPIVVKMGYYVGLKVAGWPGAIVATLGISLPGFLLMAIMTAFFMQYKDSPKVAAMLKAVRPVVVALLALVVWEVFPVSVKSWDTALILGASFLLVAFTNIHPALVITAAALLGLLVY
ncbi:MAG: chromate transporter [Chloroflexi bacterium]|nr:chromate transporter [Chloroflexota bacterium]